MKIKIILLIATITLFSCKKETATDYAIISGKITNHLGNDGNIKSRSDYEKAIRINKDGTFKDTLHIKNTGELFSFTDGNEFTSMYLKNGDEIHLSLDTKEFDETVKYTGTGSVNNNYLAQKSLSFEKVQGFFKLDKEAFVTKVTEFVTASKKRIIDAEGLDVDLAKIENEEFDGISSEFVKQYDRVKDNEKFIAGIVGKPSPEFNNYENINGKKTSLKDLRGKYVYVDVWATWCGPCKAEIPFLKELEKANHGKDIEFVSISVDEEKDKEAWKKMIADKELKGVQLFADKSWQSKFVTDYKISGIPRFILIDKKGNVINPDAPRPSSNEIKEIIKELNI